MATLNKTKRRILSSLAAAAPLALVASACAPEFDTAATVDSLRVLGVQKDKPYAKPGDEVNLAALWVDANERPAGEVTFWWVAGCVNPPRDLYFMCFEELDPSKAVIGSGNEFSFTIPEDIISSRPKPKDPGVTPYGLAYVFFAACAGELKQVPIDTSGANPTLPFGCFSRETGEQLTQDDFIAGYTAVYAYDDLTHENPSITGFESAPPLANPDDQPDWTPLTPDCIGVECVSEEPEAEPACDDPAEDDSCPAYPISPIITRPPPETGGRTVAGNYQVWIAYLSDRATFTQELTLAQDENIGWLEDYSTEFRAPAETGLTYIWAVVRDSLGGQNWVRIRVLVQ